MWGNILTHIGVHHTNQEFYKKHNLANELFLFNKETLVEIFCESVFEKLKCDCQCLHF
jgi:hypothetical protein